MKTENNKKLIDCIIVLSILLLISCHVNNILINNQYLKNININEPNINESNINNKLTISTMGKFCKENEPKDYKLNAWWNGCSKREEQIGFTCAYVNKDGATLYKCHKWIDVLQLNKN